LEEEPGQMEDVLKDLKNFVEKHDIKPIIGKVFQFEDASLAHKHIESRQSFGKVLLKIGE